MNALCLENFLSELRVSHYVAVACALHAHNKVSPGECATLHLATKNGIIEGKAQPVKGRAALEKFTEVVFPDGQSKFILNEEVLPQNVGDVLFLTQHEQELLAGMGLLVVNDLAETKFDIAALSMKLQSKLLPYVNGLYIRRTSALYLHRLLGRRLRTQHPSTQHCPFFSHRARRITSMLRTDALRQH